MENEEKIETAATAEVETKENCVCCCQAETAAETAPCCCQAETAAETTPCCCQAETAAETTPCCCKEEASAETTPCCKEEKKEFKPRPTIEITDDMLADCAKRLDLMLNYLGLEGTVKAEKRTSKINLLVASSDAGRIIGRKGQSLESLQLLLNRMMQKVNIDYPKIYIDIDGYSSKNATPPPEGTPRRDRSDRRDRGERFERRPRGDREDRRPRREDRFDDNKEDILRQQALDVAKEVRHWGEPKTLPPMNAHDRRIIHVTLENDPDVTTESQGEGAMRSVVISPKKG